MITLILAKILGLYFVGFGLSFIFNSNQIKKVYQLAFSNELFLFFSGLFALFLGACLVSLHNYWIFNWSIILTLIGWLSLLKGLALLTYPKFVDWFYFMANQSTFFYRIMGLFLLALGLFLTYQGWK